MNQPQGPPGPAHLYTTTQAITSEVRIQQGTGDVAQTNTYQGYLDIAGITPQGYQHLLNNHAVLSHQIANLDTTTMAAAAARDAEEISKKVKVIRSAAELSEQAQPLLAAIQQLQHQQHQQQEQLRAIEANLKQCSCTIM